MEEPRLLELYMDLTGASELFARGVWVHVGSQFEATPRSREVILPGLAPAIPGRAFVSMLVVLLVLLSQTKPSAAADSSSATNGAGLGPLSLTDSINIALRQSPNILRARKTVEAEQGVAIQTRAIALPKAVITGDYSAVQSSDIDTPPMVIPGFTFGTEQSWRTRIQLVQSLYEGGRMVSAIRAARLTRERSLINYDVAVADLVLEVQRAYYAVLLAEQQIVVQEASVKLLERELADTNRRYEAGTVPRFNVLRAEVELANARPNLSHARNNLRISLTVLAKVLALGTPGSSGEELELKLSGKLEAEPFNVELPRAVAIALQRRKELSALRTTQALRKEDLATAAGGYKPSVQAFAGYDAHSSIFGPDLTDEAHGWMTGVQLRWDIFDGRLTEGKVKQARAQYELAGIELDDAARRVELEVRTAHSTFTEANEVLESQKKVLEQAEEALRLARSRNEAGTGTQLDVLSAQTALTEARSNQIQALHDYVVARARLERAMGVNRPDAVPAP